MIKDKLYSLQDLKYRNFSLKLLPPDTNLIGVRLPILRNLSKDLTLEELMDDTFEEVMLQGMIIGHIEDFEEFKKACLIFLPKIHNWSICDSFVSGLIITKKYPKEMFSFLKELSTSSLEYTRRFVLVMFLRWFLMDEYLEEVCTVMKEISKEEYYVEMALAWLIAEIYLKNPSLALVILSDTTYHLNRFIFRKSISKIKDSKQVSKDDKEKLNKFKIKYEMIWKEK